MLPLSASWLSTVVAPCSEIVVSICHVGRRSKTMTDKLQRIVNAAARVYSGTTEIWLRLVGSPSFWAALAWHCWANRLQAWCHDVRMPARKSTAEPSELLHASVWCSCSTTSIRSSSCHHFDVPRHRLNTYGRRAFSVAGPSVWNSLTVELQDPDISIGSFRRSLKTWLLSKY